MTAKRPRTLTAAALHRRLMSEHSRALRVAMPAVVAKYTPATSKSRAMVDADPVFIEPLPGDEQPVALPRVTNVPLYFPQSSAFYMRFPLVVGDIVLLLFSDKSLDKWLSTGGVVDPQDTRRHDLSDAIAFAGISPHTDVGPLDFIDDPDLVIGMNQNGITSKIRIVAATGNVVVESGAVIQLGSLTSASATTTATAVKNVVASLSISYLSVLMTKLLTLAAALVDATGVDPAAKTAFAAEVTALQTGLLNDLIGKLDQPGGIAVSNTKVVVD